MDLTRLYADATAVSGQAAPVKTWNPPFCGDIDMRIAWDGTWFYNGTPILRPNMVQLFARILRKEGESYFLVTPVEKVGITVEDAPFIAVDMTVANTPDQTLTFRTNVGDIVTADAHHLLRFQTAPDGGFIPYIEVRDKLYARLSRTLAQDLAALSTVVVHDGEDWLAVSSSDTVFPIQPVGALYDT